MTMNKKKMNLIRLLPLVALCLGLLFAPGTVQAATDVWLVAQRFNRVMGDGLSVPMWGYALADPGFANIQAPTAPGPFLTVTSAPLTIHLRNDLAVPVSFMLPALAVEMAPVRFTDATGRQRIRSFTAETAPGATSTYVFGTLRDGTFLYTSGTHIQVQQQMGLYGGLKIETVAGQAYPGIPYDVEQVFIYSEIDPNLHYAVANGLYGTPDYPSTMEYRPSYYLLNNALYSPLGGPAVSGGAGQTVLVRFLNAGLRPKVPQVLDGYLTLVAENGFPYPHARIQYNALVSPSKTVDATVTFITAGSLPLFDRIGYGVVAPRRDLNLDGAYNAMDLQVLLLYLNGIVVPGVAPFSAVLSAADLTGDGVVDAADAVRMAGELAGTFPW
jgi:FtsP/CotA-like multicopper oxidase with cupredoxin domain